MDELTREVDSLLLSPQIGLEESDFINWLPTNGMKSDFVKLFSDHLERPQIPSEESDFVPWRPLKIRILFTNYGERPCQGPCHMLIQSSYAMCWYCRTGVRRQSAEMRDVLFSLHKRNRDIERKRRVAQVK